MVRGKERRKVVRNIDKIRRKIENKGRLEGMALEKKKTGKGKKASRNDEKQTLIVRK
jgi:hypothetical protein